MKRLPFVAVLAFAPSLFAQTSPLNDWQTQAMVTTSGGALGASQVAGINLRGDDELFVSNVNAFVAGYTPLAPVTPMGTRLFALDFDVFVFNLWGIDYDTSEFGTITPNGVFTPLGTTPFAPTSATGMTAHPNGSIWYVMSAGELWAGDITTGTFTLAGPTGVTGTFIDIACDASGNLFGFNIGDDSLYSLDGATGAATLLGPVGLAANFAQGMDFDWATNTLWAAIYTGGGTGQFVSLNTTDGSIITMEDTVSLDAEIEMAVLAQAGTIFPTGVPFCDPMDPNSTGFSTTLFGTTSPVAGAGVRLDAVFGPPGEMGYFLIGSTSNDPGIPLREGRLCLGTNPLDILSRYNVAGTEMNSLGTFNANGILENISGTSSILVGFDVPLSLPFDPAATIMAGQTWHFQLWHRDILLPNGQSGSNFSNGLSVAF